MSQITSFNQIRLNGSILSVTGGILRVDSNQAAYTGQAITTGQTGIFLDGTSIPNYLKTGIFDQGATGLSYAIYSGTIFGDRYLTFGQEYLWSFHKKIMSGLNVNIIYAGDSKVAGTGLSMSGLSPYTWANMTNTFMNTNFGLGTAYNSGIGGITTQFWATGLVSGQMVTNPDLILVSLGTNDSNINNTVQYLKTGLTYIRNLNGPDETSVVILTPYASYWQEENMNPTFFQSFNSGVRTLARQYNCGFIDLYSMWPDAYSASGYMDNLGGGIGTGIGHVHAHEVMSLWIGSKINEFLFPSQLVLNYGANGTGVLSTLRSVAPYVQSRTQNLVSNNNFLLKNNYNFSQSFFDSDNVNGGLGSAAISGVFHLGGNDELIPVDTSKYYIYSFNAKGGNISGQYAPSGTQTAGLTLYDADNLQISNVHYTSGGLDTTLAADLHPGDTQITLNSVFNWYTGTIAVGRQFVWFPYTNSLGYTYPPYFYTRNLGSNYVTNGSISGMWNSGSNVISGNSILLLSPWTGSFLPSGTAVRNPNSSNNQQKFMTAGASLYNTWSGFLQNNWVQYGSFISGVSSGSGPNNQFSPGTCYAKFYWNFNNNETLPTISRIANFRFTETSAYNLEQASSSSYGVVNTTAQTFGGNKTFNNNVNVLGNLTVNGQSVVVGSNGNSIVINPDGGFGQFQNLLLNSNNLTSSVWSKYCGLNSGNIINPAPIAGPDGTITAIQVNTSGNACNTGGCYGIQQNITLISGGTYTASTWLMGATGNETIALGLNDTHWTNVILTTGWARYSYTATGITDINKGIKIQAFAGGNPGQSYYIWGAQVESNSGVNNYAQTYGQNIPTNQWGLIVNGSIFSGSQNMGGYWINTGQTGVFLVASQTGQFITTGQTGAFGIGSTGQFITSSQTGNFVTTGENRTLIFSNLGINCPISSGYTQVDISGNVIIENGILTTPSVGIGEFQNLVKFSNQLGSPSWIGYCGSTGNLFLNTTDYPAPDNSFSAAKFICTGTACNGDVSGSFGIYQLIPGGLISGGTYTASIWSKGATGGEILSLGLNSTHATNFPLTTYWRRYYASFTGITNMGSGFTAHMFTVNNTGTFYIWGPQVENNSGVSNYVQTNNNNVSANQFGICVNGPLYSGATNLGAYWINTGQTGQFAPSGMTGQFITTAQTGQYAPAGLTGKFVTTGETRTLGLMGNVGIGLPSPSVSLDVTGHIWTENGEISSPNGGFGNFQNMVLFSNQFNNNYWQGYCGKTGNLIPNTTDTLAPDGTQSATKFICTGVGCNGDVSGSFGIYQGVPNIISGQAYTASIWMKGLAGGEIINLGMNDSNIINFPITNYWKRYSYSTTGLSLPTSGFEVHMFTSNQGTYYIWGAQLESGVKVPGIYVQTQSGQINSPQYGVVFNNSIYSGTTNLSNYWINTGQTGIFITSAQTGGFGTALTTGQLGVAQLSTSGGFLSGVIYLTGIAGNGVFISGQSIIISGIANQTGQFITTAQTGNFGASLSTGQLGVAQLSTSGGFLSGVVYFTGIAGNSVYISGQTLIISGVANQTGQFVTLAQTGNFITNAQTGQFVTTAQTGQFITTAMTGGFGGGGSSGITTSLITSNGTLNGNVTLTGWNGSTISGSGNSIWFNPSPSYNFGTGVTLPNNNQLVIINWQQNTNTYYYTFSGTGAIIAAYSPIVTFAHSGSFDGKKILCSFVSTGNSWLPTNGGPFWSGDQISWAGGSAPSQASWFGGSPQTATPSNPITDVYEFVKVNGNIYGTLLMGACSHP